MIDDDQVDRLMQIKQEGSDDSLLSKLTAKEVGELIGAINDIVGPRPIATAPDGDGWILGDIGASDVHPTSPWIICTRCDGGWCDEGGYGVEPTHWLRLPNPQPAPTGWRRAEGEVVVECGWLGEERVPVWLISVVKPDSSYDEAREPLICSCPASAVERANDWACTLGLTWREGQMDHKAGKVVPFPRRPGGLSEPKEEV